MKNNLKTALLVLALALGSSTMAQTEKNKKAPLAPEQGYWVVESSSPLQHQVRFYNNEHVLLYSEKLVDVKLRPTKRKVQLQLKAALESAVIAWQQTKQPLADRAFVKTELR